MTITPSQPRQRARTFLHPVLAIGFIVSALAGCGGGGGNSPGASPPVTTPTVVDVPTPDLRQAHLLSDAELKSPPIAAAAGLPPPTADEQAWLAQHHHPIRSIVYDQDFSDLAFMASELEGKRIVQLGESSHGSAEFSAMKVRLIKYLHESQGFNVLAFESSLSGCHVQDLALALGAPAPHKGVQCIFGVWDTEDLNEMARYIRATRLTANPLRLAGFDVQTSSDFDSNNFILNWISPILDQAAPSLTAPARTAIVDTSNDLQQIDTCIQGNKPSCPAFDNHQATSLQRLDALSVQLRSVLDATPATDPNHQELVFAWLAIDSLHGRLANERAFLADPNAWAAFAIR